MIVLGSQAELPQMILALASASGLAGGLHRGKQQGDKDANDGDDNKQFYKRETAASTGHGDTLIADAICER